MTFLLKVNLAIPNLLVFALYVLPPNLKTTTLFLRTTLPCFNFAVKTKLLADFLTTTTLLLKITCLTVITFLMKYPLAAALRIYLFGTKFLFKTIVMNPFASVLSLKVFLPILTLTLIPLPTALPLSPITLNLYL